MNKLEKNNRTQERIKFADEICEWLDDVELKHPNSELETWKLWKHIRNGIRDKARE